ncbi:AEC family transporter [Acinetobacter sp. 194]|uniref:AEC family transporter n=1 Tax=Acinetobacter shaoyimingii TaxID=2715164 RepID=UPI00140AE68B|nr:AEC family transporter [Acinetobacter shaoyimingii]NHB57695.1 AEC family transporter [Acinetobacter shaoyimingii]
MQSILLSLFPLIALIISGYVLKQKEFLSDDFWQGAEKLNYYILFPIMLFANLATAKLDLGLMKTIFVVVGLVLSLACITLYIIRKVCGTPSAKFGVYMQSNTRFNTFMGLAIVAALFHQQGMTIFAIILAMSIPVVNVLAVLALRNQDNMDVKSIVFSLAKNPLILGCVIGALFNGSGIHLWVGFDSFLKQLALCSLPLGLLCVGAALQFMALKKDIFPLIVNTFSKLLIMPTLAFALCHWMDLSALETQIFVVYFALPTASASYILTKVLGGDSQLMAGVISLQILCSAFTLPVVLSFVL